MRNDFITAVVLISLATTSASAHVTLAEPTAKAGGYYVALFRVGHGCSGSPTIALRIEIPPNIPTARPQPKSGWTLEIQRVPLAKPQRGEMGETVTERVSAITWKGGKLAADEFDEFAMMIKLPSTSGRIVFPATQTCENGVVHWSEVAAPGKKEALKNPAPVLTVQPSSAPDNSMPGMVMPDGSHM